MNSLSHVTNRCHNDSIVPEVDEWINIKAYEKVDGKIPGLGHCVAYR